MRAVRGAEIALIFQEPMTALNPVFTRRRPDRRDASRPRARDAARGAGPRDRAAAGGAHPRSRSARGRLSAPALGRHAAARADRDGARLPAVAGHRRRADDRARRDDSGGDPRPAARDEGRAQPVAAADHARPRRHRRNGRSRRRDVRRPHRRDRAGARRLRAPAASLHARAARVDAGPAAGPPPARDRRHGAAARRSAARLRVRPALSGSLRTLCRPRRRRDYAAGAAMRTMLPADQRSP